MEAAGPGKVRITDKGVQEVGGEDALDPSDATPPTNAEYLERIISMLEKPQAAEMLKEMGDGKACTKYYLAPTLGFSHPNVHLFFYGFQELQKKSLIETCGVLDRCQLWRLVDRFFPEGTETRSDAKLHIPPTYKKPTKTKAAVSKAKTEEDSEDTVSKDGSKQEDKKASGKKRGAKEDKDEGSKSNETKLKRCKKDALSKIAIEKVVTPDKAESRMESKTKSTKSDTIVGLPAPLNLFEKLDNEDDDTVPCV